MQPLSEPHFELAAVVEQLIVHALFAQDFSSRWALGLNGALWSMVTEVQFYLAFPWLVRWMIRVQPKRFVLTALAIAP